MKRIIFILFLSCCTAAHAQLLQFMQGAFGRSKPSQSVPGIFVSSLTGSDSNPGTSNAPIATLAHAFVLANDSPTNLWLQRGSVFHESFHVPDNSIVQAYGTGAKPIVDGTLPLTASGWTLVSGNTWSYPLSRSLLLSTNPIDGFACSNVLMVWQTLTGTTTNGVYRLGTRWDLNAGYPATPGSLANVEANTGSFYYDTNAQILYINPWAGHNPTSSGDTFAASYQTLAVWGGTNFSVSDLEGRYAYAYDSSQGNEGYACDATGYGTFYHCKFHGGWNHVAGYASNDNGHWPASLVWNSCDIYDGDSAAGSSLCIGFNGGTAVPNFVFTNCLVYQPPTESSYSCAGFYNHTGNGATCTEQIIGCTVTNMGGFAGLENITVFSNNINAYPQLASDRAFGDLPAIQYNTILWWKNNWLVFNPSGGDANSTNGMVNCTTYDGVWVFDNQAMRITNCVTDEQGNSDGMSFSGLVSTNQALISISNDFQNAWHAYSGLPGSNYVIAANHNNYKNCSYGIDSSHNWGQWTNAFPWLDVNSTTNGTQHVLMPPVINDPAGT